VDLALGQDEVAEAGSMLGSGSIVAMDSSTCMVRAAWRITKFFSRESCGQCTPCREGSAGSSACCTASSTAGPRGGPRLVARRQRQHLTGARLAAAADDHLRARPLDPLLDQLGHLDVP